MAIQHNLFYYRETDYRLTGKLSTLLLCQPTMLPAYWEACAVGLPSRLLQEAYYLFMMVGGFTHV